MNRLIASIVLCGAALASPHASSQVPSTDPDWKELEATAAPAFDVSRLIEFDVSSGSSLRFGVDPATIRIGSDDVVRYVVVARNDAGAFNAFYEGIRCSRGEFKSYARQAKGNAWVVVPDPVWRPMRDTGVSRHTLRFAQQGGCVGNSTPVNAAEIVRALRQAGRVGPSVGQPY